MEDVILARAISDLERHELTTRRLPRMTGQERIDWLNRRLVELGHDPINGIVAGDGYYYPRSAISPA